MLTYAPENVKAKNEHEGIEKELMGGRLFFAKIRGIKSCLLLKGDGKIILVGKT
jgi:hypothetical protein